MEHQSYSPKELNSDEMLLVMIGYSSRISQARSVDEVLVEMNDLARLLVMADRCTVWLADKEQGVFWTKTIHGLAQRITIPLFSGMIGEAFALKKSLIVADAYADPHFNYLVDKNTGYRTRNALMVPLINTFGEIIGMYQAINKFERGSEQKIIPKDFNEQDQARLEMVAGFFAHTLESLQLRDELERSQRDLVQILGAVAESRSKETGNHINRVAEFCWILAKAKGLSPRECAMIRQAAPLHDIGKVAISDLILNKPGKLDFEEFEKMKKHAAIGHSLLADSSSQILQAGALISLQHHEKFDGTGYPNGLMGREEDVGDGGIHIYGRICAIADVFDALAHARCYKPAWTYQEIEALFRRERGKHFDPVLIDLLFANWESFLEVSSRLSD